MLTFQNREALSDDVMWRDHDASVNGPLKCCFMNRHNVDGEFSKVSEKCMNGERNTF